MKKDMTIFSVDIKPSTRKANKYMGIFKNKDKKKIKTVHFGSKGYRDYTLISNKNSDFYIPDVDRRNKVRSLYITRHNTPRENWAVPDNAGSMSRWILWEEPTFKSAVIKYKERFNLK